MSRSGGVTAFGILNIVFGCIGLVLGVIGVIVLLSAPGTVLEAFKDITVSVGWLWLDQCVNVIFKVIIIFCGIGILLLKNWARLLIMYAGVVSIIYSILKLFHPMFRQGEAAAFGGAIAVIFVIAVWYGVIVWFFNRQSVKAQFVKSAPTAPVEQSPPPMQENV